MSRDVDIPVLLERLGFAKPERRGRALWAPCPFHEERTPSWSIVDDPGGERHGFHHCHGCGEGGGVSALVAHVLDLRNDAGELDYRAARDWLGGDQERPLPVTIEIPAPKLARRGLVLPSGVVVAPFARWASPARRYVERRGITGEQVERWGLGYAVDGRLAGRIVFPVRDRLGRLVSYTARDFAGAGRRKYLEPEQDEGADKSAIFGEQHWPDDRKRVVVIEGAPDALAVERVVGGAVGAVYGSQLLPGAIARLSTFREVVVATDPDKAGQKLARAIVGALGRWSTVLRVTMPEGFDAAALAIENPEALRVAVERAA